MKSLIVIAAGVTALSFAPAMAQPVQPMAPQMQRMAAPQSRAQVVDRIRTQFARLDVNRDGYLTKAEAQSARAMRQQQRAANRANRGGQARTAAFDRFDTNRDGAISRGEWEAMSAQRQQRRMAQGGKPRGPRMARMGGGLGGRMFDTADANRDGRVTFAEAQNAALARFDRVDLNRDGQVTPEERRQNREQMRAQRRS